MKTLATQVGAFTTTTAIAEAVLTYWLALAQDNRADVVEVPFLTPEGSPAQARLTLSPSSGLAVLDAPGSDASLRDASALAGLRARIDAASSAANGAPFDDDDDDSLPWDAV